MSKSVYKALYWLSIVLIVIGLVIGGATIALEISTNGNDAFEFSQLIIPLVCLFFSLLGLLLMFYYKKRL